MKTLDEVIKKFELCNSYSYDMCNSSCPYFDDKCACDPDALHYLKAYKENQYAYEEGNRKAEEARERYLEAVKNCELAENKYKKLCEETSQELRNTSQITCPKCHSVFEILDDPDGDRQQLLKCQALLQDFYRNDPLTWDELKGMEGKPVWVEYNLHLSDEDARSRMWIIIQHIFPWKKDNELIYYNGLVLGKKEMGKTWNAYRKERE